MATYSQKHGWTVDQSRYVKTISGKQVVLRADGNCYVIDIDGERRALPYELAHGLSAAAVLRWLDENLGSEEDD